MSKPEFYRTETGVGYIKLTWLDCNTALSEADFKGRVWNYCPVCGFIMEDATNE